MLLPPWAYAGAALALSVGGFATGWKVQGWRCEAAQADALRDAAKKMDAAATRMRDASAEYETGKAYAQAEDYARNERIRTIFRDRVVNADCAAPDDARRMLAEAVAGANATAAGKHRPAMSPASDAASAVD